MLKEIKKIWLETTTNPKTGRYSMTSLQVVVATFICVLFSIPHAVEIHIWPDQSWKTIPPPEWLIIAWMAVAFSFAGLSQYGKNQARKSGNTETNNENENE